MSMSSTHSDFRGHNAAAWAFVMDTDHARILTRTCARIAKKSPIIEAAELENATILRCVDRFEEYDPGKAKFQTWVFWQCRAAKRQLERMFTREPVYPVQDICEGRGPRDPVLNHVDDGAARRMRARAEVAVILAGMPENVREVAVAKAEGLSGNEIAGRLGVSSKSAIRRLARWRAHHPTA